MPFFFVDQSKVTRPTDSQWQSTGLPGTPNTSSSTEYASTHLFDDCLEKHKKRAQRHQDTDNKWITETAMHLTVGDVMSSPVITLNEHDQIKDALKLFAQHPFRHLPILSKQQKLIGILSERDIIHWMDKHAQYTWQQFYATPLQQVMITSILTVNEEMDVREVAHIMANKALGALPVIQHNTDTQGPELIGIVTKSDLFQLIIHAAGFQE